MENPKREINVLDFDGSINEIEWTNDAISFLSSALPGYPNAGGLDEVAWILQCLSEKAGKALNVVKEGLGLKE